MSETEHATRYCPRCNGRVHDHVTRGPGDYRVGPCGCLVAHTRYGTLPTEPLGEPRDSPDGDATAPHERSCENRDGRPTRPIGVTDR